MALVGRGCAGEDERITLWTPFVDILPFPEPADLVCKGSRYTARIMTRRVLHFQVMDS
jgi:hypothetical protein